MKYFYREIGEGDWMECDKEWYAYCVTSPLHDYKTEGREVIKDTLFMQELSLVAFANSLGFYMVQNSRGVRFFADASDVKISFDRMIEWHNGVIRGRGFWRQTARDIANWVSQIASRRITEEELSKAYGERLVYEIKYKYSKKKACWIKQYDTDNIIKYTERGRANYNIK